MPLAGRISASDCILRGPNLRLRPLNVDDASERYLAWLNDPDINRYSGRFGQSFSMQDVCRYIAECAASDDRVLFGAFADPSGTHFGNILLSDINAAAGTAEVSNLIGDRKQMPQGGALEANRLLIDFAFSALNLTRLSIGNVRGHRAAIFLTRQLGFEPNGVDTAAIVIGGVLHDRLRFTLSREMFYANPARANSHKSCPIAS